MAIMSVGNRGTGLRGLAERVLYYSNESGGKRMQRQEPEREGRCEKRESGDKKTGEK